MLFAKALYVVFILSLANFGESERLNTYDNTTDERVLFMTQNVKQKKSIVTDKRNVGKIKAEQVRGFLVSKMLKHWKTLDPVKVSHFTYGISGRRPILKHYEIDKEDKDELDAHRGVYFICCSTVKNDIYPVYVGVTSQSFKDRLTGHKGKGGVLSDIHCNKWELGFCDDFLLYVKAADPPAAKFLESTFLAAFDFARNKAENGEKREELVKSEVRYSDQIGKERLWETIDEKLENLNTVMDNLKRSIWLADEALEKERGVF